MRARLNDDRSDALRRGKSQPRRIRAIRNDGLDARRPLFLRAGAHQRLHIAAASGMRMTRFLMLHMRYSEAMLEFPCYFQEFRTAVLARGAAPSSAAVRNTSFCPNGDCTCL